MIGLDGIGLDLADRTGGPGLVPVPILLPLLLLLPRDWRLGGGV